MSLVMEALRRVEKPGAGVIGASVASYSRTPRRRSAALPLLLGLASGGAVALLFDPSSTPDASGPAASSPDTRPVLPLKGGAGLPPPFFPEAATAVRAASIPEASPSGGAEPSSPAAPAPGPSAAAPAAILAPTPAAPLTLQAISERDAQPIAVINDLLVRVGDRIGLARVTKIGPDFVEVLRDNGRHDTVRFAPPPPQAPEPSPTPDPR